MGVKKISIALDPDVAEAASSAARAQGLSLSSWLNEAARDRLRVEDGLRAVSEWEAEHGKITPEERADADDVLDRLLRRTGRST